MDAEERWNAARRPRVTVLMTVFNTEAYLEAAIDSVLSQTLTDVELIVIDDCSTDGSWPIIASASSRDSRVVALRRMSRGGASAGLNAGLARATGEYIARQDGDDLSQPTRLAEQAAFLDRHQDVGAVGTQATLIDSAGKRFGATILPERDEEIQPRLLDSMCFIGPTVMVRRTAFEKAGFWFDESLSGSEDYDVCLRLGEVAALANMSEPLYLYRHHPSSVSRCRRPDQLSRKASALEKAVHRRFPQTPPAGALATVARDYLRAAVCGYAIGEAADWQAWLTKAQALDPELFSNLVLVERVVRRYTPETSVAAAIRFTESLFDDLLPRTRRMSRLQRRLVAELHVKAVFDATGSGQSNGIRQHLWSAIRNNPAWLGNRGVLSLLVRGFPEGRSGRAGAEGAS